MATQNRPLSNETPAETVISVVPVGQVEPAPTMEQAFMTLCKAMLWQLEGLPSQLHAEEIMGWYANGGGNETIAWKHAIVLLEQAIGVPLRG